MSPEEQQRQYLRLVRTGPGYVAFLKAGSVFTQRWYENDEHALRLINQYSETHNLWVSMAEYPNPEGARSADNAARLCSFWLDVDAHEGSKYGSPAEAEAAVFGFCRFTELSQPNLINRTGHGVQAFWALDKVLSREEWEPTAEKLQLLAEAHQLDADPITADAARVLRIPGTLNFRNPDVPVRAELVVLKEGLINLDELEGALNAAAEKLAPQATKPKLAKPNTKFENPHTPENVAIIKAMLGKIDPDPKRNTWRDIIWGVASTGYPEAYDLARAWSESGDGWDEYKFDRIWNDYKPEGGIGFGTLVHHARAANYTGLLPQSEQQEKTNVLVFTTGRLRTRCASDIQPESVNWLVEGSIPLGMLMVIGGEPGLGKSQIAIKLAAAITTGKGLPDEH